MQYLLSEEEYQQYQEALKAAEAARSDAAKMDAYAAARDTKFLSAYRDAVTRLAPHLVRPIAHVCRKVELELLADRERRDPLFYVRRLAQIAAVYEDDAEE